MAKADLITQEYLRSILHYDPETGVFTWRQRSDVPPAWNTKLAGKQAGRRSKKKRYITIAIFRKAYRAHRLAFLYMTGEMPPLVDHKNLDIIDNRWSNLRKATKRQNSGNSKLYRNNTSGHRGIIWDNKNKKWCARIKTNGKSCHIGYFETLEAAVTARRHVDEKIFGEFARST